MTPFTTTRGCDAIDWLQLVALCAEVGLVGGFGNAKDRQQIEQAFRNSSGVVAVWDGAQLIAAGRVFTDGTCYATVFDGGVLPAYQKRGVGRLLMEGLLHGLDRIYVHLTSTFGNQKFYGRLGFKRHKTAMGKYSVVSDYIE